MKITAVILCSGFGRRMGTNKLLLPIKGKRMFEYVLDTVYDIRFYKTAVVTPYDEIKNYAENKGFAVAYNAENEEGISASVRIGAGLAEGSDGIMFFTADQPLIDADSVGRLIDDFERYDKITVPVFNGQNKNPVIFPVRYKKALLSLSGDAGGRQIINANKDDISKVFFDRERPFLDMDTTEDFKLLN